MRAVPKKKKPPSPAYPAFLYSISLIGLGVVVAMVLLFLNQQFPIKMNIASLLSPTGAQATIAGLRIKHWLEGVIISILGVALARMETKKPLIKEMGFVLVGLGGFFIFDEYEAVFKTITTGVYP